MLSYPIELTHPWKVGSSESKETQEAHVNEGILFAPHVNLKNEKLSFNVRELLEKIQISHRLKLRPK